jgi:DNA-binding NtrC family response regulator
MSPVVTVPFSSSREESRHTVLVVEDEALIRRMMADFLRGCGFHVCGASSVTEAKAVLETDSPVDLVFSDVNLPGDETGIDLAKWIKKTRPDTRVLLTSGGANAAEMARSPGVGCQFMAKPYSPTAVVQRIEGLLRPTGTTG